MKLDTRTRWSLIACAGVVTIGLIAFAPAEQEGRSLVQVAARSAERSTSSADVGTPLIDAVRPRHRANERPAELFGMTQRPVPVVRAVPKPVLPPALPISPPEAPPLPFTLLGRLEDAEGVKVFARYGNQDVVLSAGAKVDEKYLVESIKQGVVTMVYLPLDQRQTLNIGERP